MNTETHKPVSSRSQPRDSHLIRLGAITWLVLLLSLSSTTYGSVMFAFNQRDDWGGLSTVTISQSAFDAGFGTHADLEQWTFFSVLYNQLDGAELFGILRKDNSQASGTFVLTGDKLQLLLTLDVSFNDDPRYEFHCGTTSCQLTSATAEGFDASHQPPGSYWQHTSDGTFDRTGMRSSRRTLDFEGLPGYTQTGQLISRVGPLKFLNAAAESKLTANLPGYESYLGSGFVTGVTSGLMGIYDVYGKSFPLEMLGYEGRLWDFNSVYMTSTHNPANTATLTAYRRGVKVGAKTVTLGTTPTLVAPNWKSIDRVRVTQVGLVGGHIMYDDLAIQNADGIQFDNVAEYLELLQVLPFGYAGMRWVNFAAESKLVANKPGYESLLNSGFVFGVTTGNQALYNVYGGLSPSEIIPIDGRIDVVSMYITAAAGTDNSVVVSGWRDGKKVVSSTVLLSVTTPKLFSPANWVALDRLVFESYTAGVLTGAHFIIDDLRLAR